MSYVNGIKLLIDLLVLQQYLKGFQVSSQGKNISSLVL